jgi:undecaprenyl-diphosphatase
MHPLLRKLLTWIDGVDHWMLIFLLLLAGSAWGFAEIAEEVRHGETQGFDEFVLRAMRNPDNPADPIGPRWLEEMGRDLTALGGVAAITLVTAAVGGYLLIRKKFHALWLLVAASVGGLLVSTALKQAFDRPRPKIVPHLSYVDSPSFPSGHSMLSAIVYLSLGALLARIVEEKRLKIYFLSVAVVLTFLVGVSRVYMGVHYPTDVLGGWAAGCAWALACGAVVHWLQKRGKVEKGDA